MRSIAPLGLALLLLGCDTSGLSLDGSTDVDAREAAETTDGPDIPSSPSYVEAQYRVTYLSGEDTRIRVGTLSTTGTSRDFHGYCNAIPSGETRTIDILVADLATWPTPEWMLRFNDIEWIEGMTTSVTCHHVEIFDEGVGSDFIPCAGGAEGTCQATVSRNEDLPHTVQVWFMCNEFETNVSTGGVPNTMSIETGAMQIHDCGAF